MGSLRLGEILIRRRLISESQLAEALAEQVLSKDYLGVILIRKGWLTEDIILRVLSEQSGFPIVSLKGAYIDWSVCRRFIGLIESEKKFFPLSETDDVVTVAISNPLDVAVTSKIDEYVRPKRIKLVLVSYAELESVLREAKQRSRDYLKKIIDKEE
jgi:MSHA biogenesis protein MshE